MIYLIRFCVAISIVVLFSSCSVKYANNSNTNKITKLQNDIMSLSSNVDKLESTKVATVAILHSKKLANEYDLVSPPLYHNSLVQMGFRKRGLCFHFTQDLMTELKKLKLKTLDLRWVTHAKAQYWEHSSLVIVEKGKSIDEGLIFDAWRNSGELYWATFKKDSKYSWIEDIKRSKYYGTVK